MLIVLCLVTTLASLKHQSSFVRVAALLLKLPGELGAVGQPTLAQRSSYHSMVSHGGWAWAHFACDVLPAHTPCGPRLCHSSTLNCLSSQGIKRDRKGEGEEMWGCHVWYLFWKAAGLLPRRRSALQQLCADFQVSSLLGSWMANKPYPVIWYWKVALDWADPARPASQTGLMDQGSQLFFKSFFPQFGHSFTCQGKAQLEPMNLRMVFIVWKITCLKFHVVHTWCIWALWDFCSPSRPQYWSRRSWSDRSTQTPVWHMGQHSECSQPNGQYRGAWQDSGKEFTGKRTLPALCHLRVLKLN